MQTMREEEKEALAREITSTYMRNYSQIIGNLDFPAWTDFYLKLYEEAKKTITKKTDKSVGQLMDEAYDSYADEAVNNLLR